MQNTSPGPIRKRAGRARLVASLTLAVAAVVAAPAASAASILCGALSGYGGSTPETPFGSLRNTSPCVASSSPANGGLILAEADSDRGIVRASSTVAFPVGVSHVSQSSAIWEEEFWTINHPDPAFQGTSGVLRFEFFIEGFLDATGAGQSSVGVTVSGDKTSQYNLYSAGANSSTGPKAINAFVEGSLFFTFGEEGRFSFNLITRAERRTGVSGEGFAEAVFNNTGYFAGVTAVEDSSGNPVSGFTFSGFNTGFDFNESQVPAVVPLPASAWLLLTGIGFLGARRLRKPV